MDGRHPTVSCARCSSTGGVTVKTRTFGRTGWEVSEIGYGMWGMAGWTDSDDEESLHSMQRAVDLGCNFFDTAWGYGEGHSEQLLGELVRANPDQRLYTATKVPPKNFQWPSRREHALIDCFPADHIRAYVALSLENSGLDSLDLMQLHTWEDGWLEDDQWIRALETLRDEAVIGAIGISINRWEPWNGVQAVRSGLIDSVQAIYNIFDQNPEDELLPACAEHGVAFVARVPFDEGTLTGAITRETVFPDDDWRSTYFVPENLESSVAHAEALYPLVPDDISLPEMALRFILSEPRISTVIPGMRKLAHVESNIACSDAGPLHTELVRALKAHRWDREPTSWSQ